MPKIKADKMEMRRREVRAIVLAGQARENISDGQLALKMHRVKRTVQNRRREPELFTLEELWCLCDVLNLSYDDRATILGGKRDAAT